MLGSWCEDDKDRKKPTIIVDRFDYCEFFRVHVVRVIPHEEVRLRIYRVALLWRVDHIDVDEWWVCLGKLMLLRGLRTIEIISRGMCCGKMELKESDRPI